MKHEIIDLNCHSGDLRYILETVGIIRKQRVPEEIRCPKCSNKTLYTWRHCVETNICMAFECSCCDFNAVVSGLPISEIGTLLKKLK